MTPPVRRSSAPLDAAVALSRSVGAVARPVAALVLHPPLLAEPYHPATLLTDLVRRGAERGGLLLRDLSGLLDLLVPVLIESLVRRLDLTELVRTHVDLDGLVARVDLDAAAGRLDVDAVARRLDIEAVIDRLDLTAIVRERVDLDLVVSGVDLDAVATRLDMEAIIERIDLVSLVEEVIAEIDLPEIIRQSTGSMASETVRGVRMQGISADEAVSRAVDRLRLRRHRPPSGPAAVSQP